jgi:hypothetical protein
MATTREVGKPDPISKKEFEAALQKVLRRAERLKAVLNGDAGVMRVWREGYKEKKIREVNGHWMTIITTKKRPEIQVFRKPKAEK